MSFRSMIDASVEILSEISLGYMKSMSSLLSIDWILSDLNNMNISLRVLPW